MVGTWPEENDIISCRPKAYKVESIYIDLSEPMNMERPQEENDCHHFSIRGYTAEMRKKDKRRCVTLEIDDNQKNSEEEKKKEEATIVLPPLVIRKFRWWKCPKCMGLCTAEAAATEVIAAGEGSDLAPPGDGLIILLSDSDPAPENDVNQENADPKIDEMETNPSLNQNSNPEEGSDQEKGPGNEKNQEIALPRGDRMESDSPLVQKSHSEVVVPGQENGSGNEKLQEIVPPSCDRMESDSPSLVQKSHPEGEGSAPAWKGKGVVEYGEPSCRCTMIHEDEDEGDDDYYSLLKTAPENDWILIEKSDDDDDDDFFDDDEEDDEEDDNYPRNDRKMRHLNELSAPIENKKRENNSSPSTIVSDDDDLLVSQFLTANQGRRLAVRGNRKKSTPLTDGGRSGLPQSKTIEPKKNEIKIGNAEKVDRLVLKESNKRDATTRKRANSTKSIIISDSDSDYDYEEEDEEEEDDEDEEVVEEEEELPLAKRTHRGRNKKPSPPQEAVVINKGKRPHAKRGKSINMGIAISDSAVNLGGITRSRRTPRRTIKKPTQFGEKSCGGSDGGGGSKPVQSEERKSRFAKNLTEKEDTPKKSCGGSRIFPFDLNEEAPEGDMSPIIPRQSQQAGQGTTPTEVKTGTDVDMDYDDCGPSCIDDLD